jgi:hypothetical protein
MMAVTGEQFDQMKQEPRSRWAGLIQKLLRSADGHVEPQPIPEEDDYPAGRRRIDQAIRSLGRHRGLKLSVLRKGKFFLVKRVGTVSTEVTQ